MGYLAKKAYTSYILVNRFDPNFLYDDLTRYLRINNTILINAGTTSNIRTRARLGHSFNIIDISSDGKVKVIERNISQEKNMLTNEFQI